MDEKRFWAELLATQAMLFTASATLLSALSRTPEIAQQRRAEFLEAAQQTLRQMRPEGLPEDDLVMVHAEAEARLDLFMASLGGEPEAPPQS